MQHRRFRKCNFCLGCLRPVRHIQPGNPTATRRHAHHYSIIRNIEHFFNRTETAPRQHRRIKIVEPQRFRNRVRDTCSIRNIIAAEPIRHTHPDRRQRGKEMLVKIPTMRLDGIQGGIIQCSHQLCRSRPPIGQCDPEPPCFFRTRLQTVAERCPRKTQLPFRTRTDKPHFPCRTTSVPHQIKHSLHPVCPIWHGRISEVHDGIGHGINLFLQNTVFTEQHVI